MSMERGAVFTRSLRGKTFTFDMLPAFLWLPRARRCTVKSGGDVVAVPSHLVNEAGAA